MTAPEMWVRSWVVRRCAMLLIPLLLVLSLGALGVSLVLLPVGVVLDLARRKRVRVRSLRVSAGAVAYFAGEVVGILVCGVLWVASGLGWKMRSPWVVRAHRVVLRELLGWVMGVARVVYHFRVEVEEPVRAGDLRQVASPAPIVVLARHAGPGASFALAHTLLRRYRRDLHVVLKEDLRWDPIFDLLLTRTGCTWVGGGGAETVRAVERAAARLEAGHALLLFPEGADWTPVRHTRAVLHLRRKGLVKEALQAMRMPHVLPPRPAGTVAALQGAKGADVLIFTHTGHDELLDAASTWEAIPLTRPLRMTWWRVPAEEVPQGEEVQEWLLRTWEGIDAWIEEQTLLQGMQESAPRE